MQHRRDSARRRQELRVPCVPEGLCRQWLLFGLYRHGRGCWASMAEGKGDEETVNTLRKRLAYGLIILAAVALLVGLRLVSVTQADPFDSPLPSPREYLPIVRGGTFDSPLTVIRGYLPLVQGGLAPSPSSDVYVPLTVRDSLTVPTTP